MQRRTNRRIPKSKGGRTPARKAVPARRPQKGPAQKVTPRYGPRPGGRRKSEQAPQVDEGTFPIWQDSTVGSLPVAWAWRPSKHENVEVWALLSPGSPGGFRKFGPTAGPVVRVDLRWDGQFPHGGNDARNAADVEQFLGYVVQQWPHVGSASNLTPVLLDYLGTPAPGALGLFEPGRYRVRQTTPSSPPVAWVWRADVPGGLQREKWCMRLQPLPKYKTPGSLNSPAVLIVEYAGVAGTEADFMSWIAGAGGGNPTPASALEVHDMRASAAT